MLLMYICDWLAYEQDAYDNDACTVNVPWLIGS